MRGVDLLLYQTEDGGEIDIAGGEPEGTGGLPTAVYLSLFGGNEEDSAREGDPRQWWGNIGETDTARRYRSETGYLLRSIPAIPANLRRLEDAARRDLAWLEGIGAASSVDVAATMPALNRVSIAVAVTAEGEPERFEYIENWKADL